MIKDSGSVPLSCKGAVIGISAKTLDVLWDDSFMSGSTLGDKFVTHSDGFGQLLTDFVFQVFQTSRGHG